MLKIAYFSMFFLVMYTVLILCYRKRPEMKPFLTYLMVLVVFCELTLNMNVTGIASTSSRGAYYESTGAYQELNAIALEDAADDGFTFFRSETSSHSTRNDGARFGYNSISTFSSVSSAAIQDYYDEIGLQTSFNAYSYYGHTPLTASLFSIKYEYSAGAASLPEAAELLSSTNYTTAAGSDATLNLYEYKNTLPLGFMINSSTMSEWDTTTGNPFITQNNFVTSAVSGGIPLFHRLKSTDTGTFTTEYDLDEEDSYEVTGEEKTFDVYFFCSTSAESLTATISGTTSNTLSFSSTHQNYICHVGNVSEGSTITITAGDNSSISACYAYAFDNDAWLKDFELLNANPYQVSSYSDTKITGTITTDKTGIMYTSIPYDKGWSVSIDGLDTKTVEICDGALTGVLVSPGTHEITFKYCPQGFVTGIVLSIICIAILLCIIFKDRILTAIHKKKKK